MTLKEFLSKELLCRYVVYLDDPMLLTSKTETKLFDSFWDVDDEEQKQSYFDMYETYGDYEVKFFYVKEKTESDTNIPSYINAYIKIIIGKPVDETKLPF